MSKCIAEQAREQTAATQRVADLSDQLMRVLPGWSLAPVVDLLVALRGIDKLAATDLLAELGDISRFESPKQLMAYLGLVPSEHSTGSRRHQGAITLTGAQRKEPTKQGGMTDILTQGLFGRCGEPLGGLHRHRPRRDNLRRVFPVDDP